MTEIERHLAEPGAKGGKGEGEWITYTRRKLDMVIGFDPMLYAVLATQKHRGGRGTRTGSAEEPPEDN